MSVNLPSSNRTRPTPRARLRSPSPTSRFGWRSLTALVALSLLVFTAVTALAQDSCSGRKAACDNVCWQRSGSAQVECNEYCKRQMASCLKTGVFKTRGGDYSGLQKK